MKPGPLLLEGLQTSPLATRIRRLSLETWIASVAVSQGTSAGINLVYANALWLDGPFGASRAVGRAPVLGKAAPPLFVRGRMAILTLFLIPRAIRAWLVLRRLSHTSCMARGVFRALMMVGLHPIPPRLPAPLARPVRNHLRPPPVGDTLRCAPDVGRVELLDLGELTPRGLGPTFLRCASNVHL